MKFRLVWMGPEDDPHAAMSSSTRASLAGSPSTVRYEQRGTEMVRRELLASATKIIPLANFTARIVRDLLLDDDTQLRREFEIVAELDGTKTALVLPAAEFGRMGWVLDKLG